MSAAATVSREAATVNSDAATVNSEAATLSEAVTADECIASLKEDALVTPDELRTYLDAATDRASILKNLSVETVDEAMQLLSVADAVEVQAARLRCIRNVRLTKQMGGKFGVTFGAATDVRGRVLIEKIFIGYPAVESGEIEAGDQVLAVNKQLVATPEAAHKLCIAALEFVELRTVSRSLRWLDAGG